MTRTINTSKLSHIVYNRCIKGDTQKNILIHINKNYGESYDKSYISRIIKRLMEGGFLICANPTSRDKMYIATKKTFLAKKDSLVYKLPSSVSQRLRGRCELIQIQKSSFISAVIKTRENITWDKVRDLKNGVTQYQYSYPFENIGIVIFIRTKGKRKDSFQIILPRLLWDKSSGDPFPFLKETANYAGAWFMKHFKIELSGLKICQKPDFSSVLTDKKLIDLAKTGTFKAGGFSIDCSPPDCLPEIENKDFSALCDLIECPKEIEKLKIEIKKIKADISEICESVTGINNSIGELKVQLNEFFNSFNCNQLHDKYDTFEGYA